MVTCARCCLHNSVRTLNFFVNLCGVAVIIYTLWLLKKWQDGISELPPVPIVPTPWFIYTCLGVGMAVCFSTMCSYLVAHCITDFTLLIYILSIIFLLCLEVSVTVKIFYKMDWAAKLAQYIDKYHTEFKDFMIFHLYLCRLLAILILVPQIKCMVLAIILWAIGTEPQAHCNYSEHVTNYRYSFLLSPSAASFLDMSRRGFGNYEALPRSDQYEYPPRQTFFSHIYRFVRMRFHRRVTLS